MLEALALVSRYQRDEEIYPQEGSVECWCRVISGVARRFALRADGRRQTVDLLLPGDFFGFGVHGMHAFTERKRHLLRLWLSPPGARPLPPVFAECYGGITIGDRGGIVCKGTQLHVPLTPS
jgi:hypothetical protein